MDLFEVIQGRRSIRRFEERPVPEKVIKQILASANQAPSANNGRPWRFVTITTRAVLKELAEINKNWWPAEKSPLCILVVADLEGYPCSHVDYYMQDCAACTQNLLLAAHALGLGAVWMGCCPVEERMEAVRKLLGIPQEIVPFAVVALGYPAEHPKRSVVLQEELIHSERWG